MKTYEKLNNLVENIKVEEYRLLALNNTLKEYQRYFVGSIYNEEDIKNMIFKLQLIRDDLEYTTKYIKSAINYYYNNKPLDAMEYWRDLEND